jgi:hypothetical protein
VSFKIVRPLCPSSAFWSGTLDTFCHREVRVRLLGNLLNSFSSSTCSIKSQNAIIFCSGCHVNTTTATTGHVDYRGFYYHFLFQATFTSEFALYLASASHCSHSLSLSLSLSISLAFAVPFIGLCSNVSLIRRTCQLVANPTLAYLNRALSLSLSLSDCCSLLPGYL